ncbi:MAG: VWA domain-containing protein [Deltaproteobacteria bacterium]|nr:VWA domain-containing protein [Deltaproteobacteria bacterium]
MKNRNLNKPIIIILLIVCWVLAAFVPLAFAQEAGEFLDIVLIIDNSGSMEENDQFNWRLTAANIIITYAHRGDRIAVILFSDNPRSVNNEVGLPSLAFLEEGAKDRLRDRIGRFTASGNTDIILALKKAQEALRARTQKRRSLTFLLTDGEMHPPKGRYPDSNWDKYLSPVLNMYIDKELPVHGIALTAKADSPFLRNISNQTRGGYEKIDDAREIVGFYLEQYRALTDEVVKFAESGQVSFNISREQQLQELTFALLVEGGAREISSLTSAGQDRLSKAYHSETSWDKQNIGSFFVLRQKSPEVGLWRLVTTGSGEVKAWIVSRLLPSSPYKRLVIREIKKEYTAGEEIPIEVVFVDEQGNVINDPSFLEKVESVEAIITFLETNEENTLRLKGPSEEGVYKESFIADSPGGYTIETKVNFSELGERQTPQKLIIIKEFRLEVTPRLTQAEVKPAERNKEIGFSLKASGQRKIQVSSPVTVEVSDFKQDGKVVIPKDLVRIEPSQLTITTQSALGGKVIIDIPTDFQGACEGRIRFSASHAVSDEMKISILRALPAILSLEAQKTSLLWYEPLEIKATLNQPALTPGITLDVLYPNGKKGKVDLTKQTDTIYGGVFKEASQAGEYTFTPSRSNVYNKGKASLKVEIKPPVVEVEVSKLKRLGKGKSQEITITLKSSKLYRQKDFVVEVKPEEKHEEFLSVSPQRKPVTLTPKDNQEAASTFTVKVTALKKLPWFSSCKLKISVDDPKEMTVGVKGEVPWYVWLIIAIVVIALAWIIWCLFLVPKFDENAYIVIDRANEIRLKPKQRFCSSSLTIGSAGDIRIEDAKRKHAKLVARRGGGCALVPLRESEISLSGLDVEEKMLLYDGALIEIGNHTIEYREG